ncbi:unnamed protein product [Effrenium voratum]|nr:unnamed protein product [Effrenium voratum]
MGCSPWLSWNMSMNVKPKLRRCEEAAERMLGKDPDADVAMAGFPSAWREPELRVFLGPVGEYEDVKVVKDPTGVAVCLVRASEGCIPSILAARLKMSHLTTTGLQVVLSTKEVEDQAPQADHQFQKEERAALFNLRSQTELNGSPCTILRYDKEESSRWLVRLETEQEDNEILVSAANLLPVWPKADAADAEREVEDACDGDAEAEAEDIEMGHGREGEELSEREEEPAKPKAEAKGKVKFSHAVVVTGFPLWDVQQITEYFARFGELRTVLGTDKAKNGKRKLLVAYCRKGNARRSQAHVDGAEIDGFKLHAFFPDDAFQAKQAKARAARPTIRK